MTKYLNSWCSDEFIIQKLKLRQRGPSLDHAADGGVSNGDLDPRAELVLNESLLFLIKVDSSVFLLNTQTRGGQMSGQRTEECEIRLNNKRS